MDKNKKIGFAVIGYGGMGSWHASTCADDFKDTAELIGIYDIKPERRAAAEAEGIHAFSSREELLADDRIDLVTVATPNDVHKEIAIAAMAAGKNVISEKPVALSQEELEEMIAASKKYGKLFTVHQNRRWDPDFKCVQKILADNELGKVFRIESRVQGSRGIPGENGSAVINDWDLNGEIVKVSDWENRDAVPILAGVGLTKTMAPRTDDTIKHYPLPKVDSSWTQFYENVFAALRGEEEQLITHDQQRRLLKLVDAIFESGNENKVVFFDK